jgi:hypothetical protein
MRSCLSLRGARFILKVCFLVSLNACAMMQTSSQSERKIGETANVIDDVKAFGKSLGIEPTEALSRTAAGDKVLSMLWFWLQRAGTVALRAPVDIRMAVGFDAAKERLPVEQVYRVDGYSVYYRQGNEYADPRSAATPSFAAQGLVRRVTVIFHEDLHGDVNFDLPWDIEEAIVTPLGSLAAIEYFKFKGDTENLRQAQVALEEGRQVARELQDLVREAEPIFQSFPADEAKEKVLRMLPRYPTYQQAFERQTEGQHQPTALEAKLSHDLAYFRFFRSIAALAEAPLALKALIAELKSLPRDSSLTTVERFLQYLAGKFSASTN